jgi:hypothetical protein
MSRKLAHPTRFERVTFAFGEVPVSKSREWFATPQKTLLGSMAPMGRVCQSNLLILLGRGITSLSARTMLVQPSSLRSEKTPHRRPPEPALLKIFSKGAYTERRLSLGVEHGKAHS